jgi:hypothetical protein
MRVGSLQLPPMAGIYTLEDSDVKPFARIVHATFSNSRMTDTSREHLRTAATMYREMDMRFWLDQAEAETMEPGA